VGFGKRGGNCIVGGLRPEGVDRMGNKKSKAD
jgi:hypothetical protein